MGFMNKGKKRCGSCKYWSGKVWGNADGICDMFDYRVNINSSFAQRCEKFKRKPYQRERISIVMDD